MGELSTATLHERADAAAMSGDFRSASAYSAEALRADPTDYRARLKLGLCLAFSGRVEAATRTLAVVADTLARRGFVLAAIGACRDALGLMPGAPAAMAALERIHVQIHGVEGRGRARVPPPVPPARTVEEGDPASFLAMSDPERLVAAAEALGTKDPDFVSTAPPRTWAPFFSDLSRQAFLSLVPRMGYIKVPGGQQILQEGEDGRSLYILLHGEVRVTRGPGEPKELARLGPGALFGELALIRAKPRSATVTTTSSSELFEIDRALVDEVAAAHPSITEDIVRFARRRMLMNLLGTSKIFAPFGEPQRLELLKSFKTLMAPAGARVIDEGQPPVGLYLILEGQVAVSKRDEAGDEVILAQLDEGDVFGEIALLEDGLTTATVSTVEKTILLLLEKDRFRELAKAEPQVLEYLEQLSQDRRAENEEVMSAEGVFLEADDLIVL